MTILKMWAALAPTFQAVLRIVAAFVFIPSGTMKLFGFPMALPPDVDASAFSLVWIAGVLETFGGALFLVGFFTRPVAFVLSGLMACAYFIGHAKSENWLWPSMNFGAPAVLFCFVFLYFSAAGAGPWSVDERIRARTEKKRD